MDWHKISAEETIQEIISKSTGSDHEAVLIYKHSTRCSVSLMAKRVLEGNWDLNNVPAYYLDILQYRAISNKVSEIFGIRHESPQVLLIKDGKCIYHDSHMGVSAENVKKALLKH